jgi:serine/threonine-protein kinase mTOR
MLHDQLDLMFAGGLNEPLRQALVAIEEHIKPLRRTVQGVIYSQFLYYGANAGIERLLDMLSVILSGKPYRPLGAPPHVRSDISTMAMDINASQVSSCSW